MRASRAAFSVAKNCRRNIIFYGYRVYSANRQSARSVGVDPQIDPKRQDIVQASGLRADEGIGPYGAACRFFTILYGVQEKRRQAKAFPFEGKVDRPDPTRGARRMRCQRRALYNASQGRGFHLIRPSGTFPSRGRQCRLRLYSLKFRDDPVSLPSIRILPVLLR